MAIEVHHRHQHFALAVLSAVLVMASLVEGGAIGRRISHKRFVIHVPLKIKSHHHTHTVFTHIHHGGGKVEYKILGYSNPSHGHGHAHYSDPIESDAHAVGEESLQDLSDAHDNVASPYLGGDIVFNHFARAHNRSPGIGEIIAGENAADWH